MNSPSFRNRDFRSSISTDAQRACRRFFNRVEAQLVANWNQSRARQLADDANAVAEKCAIGDAIQYGVRIGDRWLGPAFEIAGRSWRCARAMRADAQRAVDI